MTTVFLSHSSKDEELARRVAVDLSMSDIGVWFDEWKIVVGDSIAQKISRGLEDADFVVLILTDDSVASGWVEKEWMSRIGQEASTRGVSILPILAGDCDIPVLLRDKKYADARSDYDGAIRALIEAIRTLAMDGKPVTAGARIQSGQIVFERTEPSIALFRGLINTIESGCFERSDPGLRAHIRVVSSHTALQELSDVTGLSNMTLESDEYSISATRDAPTAFTCTQTFSMPRGTMFTDIGTGRRAPLPVSLSGRTHTKVDAVSESGVIVGGFSQHIRYSGQAPIPEMHAFGTFKAVVAL